MVRAPSLATLALTSSLALPAWVLLGSGGLVISGPTGVVFMNSSSRRFHSARRSDDGAHPIIPGWTIPGKRTCGMCLEEQKTPSKSQIAFALCKWILVCVLIDMHNIMSNKERDNIRLWIMGVQEAPSILLIKNPCIPPRLLWERLKVLHLDTQDIAGLRSVDVKRTRKEMDLSEVAVFNIIGRVVVLDLPSHPIQTLDSDYFVVGYFSARGNYKGLLEVRPEPKYYIILSGCHRF